MLCPDIMNNKSGVWGERSWHVGVDEEVSQLGAGGKPATWLPPGTLVEHNSSPRGAVTNHPNSKKANRETQPTSKQILTK